MRVEAVRADAIAHLGALDLVYAGIIEAHRAGIDPTEELDLVTQDVLIGQSRQLEEFHWFVRAHLESADGTLSTPRGGDREGGGRPRLSRRRPR
jgi:starvation-inducible DNA-binding protein